MKPRNGAPINLDKCHRPFSQLFDAAEPGYRSDTNALSVKMGKPGIDTRILKSD